MRVGSWAFVPGLSPQAAHPSRRYSFHTPRRSPLIDRAFFEHVLKVAGRLASSSDLSEVLALIIDVLRDSLHAERASVFQYDPLRHELFATQAHGLSRDLRLPADLGIIGEAARTRVIINIPDAYADPRFNREVDRSTGFRTRCLLTIPLVDFQDRLIGVAQVLNKSESEGGRFTRDDELMAQYLASQAAVALKRAALLEDQRKKEKLERDIEAARAIQLAGLPDCIAEFPGYEIAGHTQPADETGGDAYDVIDLRAACDKSTADALVFLADATGHGIGPALSVTQVLAMMRMASRLGSRVEEIAYHVNRQLCQDLPTGRFVTAFMGQLDTKRHTMHYVSAGQGPLLFLRAGRPQTFEETSLSPTEMPFGIEDELKFSPVDPMVFEPGDVFLLLSDGYYEAQSEAGAMYGLDRVAEVVRGCMNCSATDILNEVRSSVVRHLGAHAAADDQTGVVVKRVR